MSEYYDYSISRKEYHFEHPEEEICTTEVVFWATVFFTCNEDDEGYGYEDEVTADFATFEQAADFIINHPNIQIRS